MSIRGIGKRCKWVNGAWSPNQLGSALLAWWSARVYSSISLSGSNVTSWTDLVAGIVASQNTPAAQPVYSATARNGKPGLICTPYNTAYLSYTVPNSFPVGSSDGTMAAALYSGTVNPAWAAFLGYGVGFNAARWLATENAPNYFYLDTGSNGAYSTVNSNQTDAILIGQFQGSAQAMWINGTSASLAPNGLNLNTVRGVGYINSWQGGTTPADSILQDLFVISGVLSTSDRQKLEGYLAWQNNIVSLLPGGHPYKSFAP